MANSDGSIVLSVTVDSSELTQDVKRITDKIKKAVKNEGELRTVTDSLKKSTKEILDNAKKRSEETGKTVKQELSEEAAVLRVATANEKALAAEQKKKTEIAKTASEELLSAQKVENERIAGETRVANLKSRNRQINQAARLRNNQNIENSRLQSEERIKGIAQRNEVNLATLKKKNADDLSTKQQINEDTLASKERINESRATTEELRNEEKISREKNKTSTQTKTNEEKIRQAKQKTAQQEQKTLQAQEKTRQAVIATEKAQNSLRNSASRVTGVLKKMAYTLGAAFSIKQLITFSNEASKLASSTEANLKRLGTIYGETAQSVYDFAEANAEAFGMSKTAAYEAAADYGNIFTTFASGAESAELTNQMLQATAVIASQTGRTYEDVFEKIRSGLYGNTRAIDDLGLSVRQSSLMQTKAYAEISENGTRSWNELTDAELQNARALGIIEQAAAKYGDEILQSSALTRSQFNAAWEDFKSTWGLAVNQILTPILDVLKDIIRGITECMQKLISFSGYVEVSDQIDSNTESQDDFTASVEKTNKELKKTLASFDDLQVLSFGKDEGAGGVETPEKETDTSAIATGAINRVTEAALLQLGVFSEIVETIELLSGYIVPGFWSGFEGADFSGLIESAERLLGVIKELVKDLLPSAKEAIEKISFAIGVIIGSIAKMFVALYTNFIVGLQKSIEKYREKIREKIASMFDASGRIAEAISNTFSALVEVLSNVLTGEDGERLTSSLLSIFINGFLEITSLAWNLGADICENISESIEENKEKIQEASGAIVDIFADFSEIIESYMDNLFGGIDKLYEDHIKPWIDDISDAFSDTIGKILDTWNDDVLPAIDRFVEKLDWLNEEKIKPFVDKILQHAGQIGDILVWVWKEVLSPILNFLIGVFLRRVWNVFSNITDMLTLIVGFAFDMMNSILDVFNGIIDFIVGVFTGDWEKAWHGVKQVFAGIINGIISIFESMINFIIAGINRFIGGLDKVVSAVGDVIDKDWKIERINDVHIKRIEVPALAKGAVIPANNKFLAVLGDQKSGYNVEAPAKLIKQMAMEAIAESGMSATPTVTKEEHYYLDKSELMSIIYKLVKDGERVSGTSLA